MSAYMPEGIRNSVCGGGHSKKVFMFKGVALYAGPSLRQVLLNNNEATVDISGQFSDIEYQVRVSSRARPLEGLADYISYIV